MGYVWDVYGMYLGFKMLFEFYVATRLGRALGGEAGRRKAGAKDRRHYASLALVLLRAPSGVVVTPSLRATPLR